MIEQAARVLRVENENAILEVQKQSECSSCSVRAGCGKSLLDNVFSSKKMQLAVKNSINAKPNDTVIVGIHEAGFVQASFYLYILPLLSFLVFAIVSSLLFKEADNELWIIIFGVIGLFAGRRLSRKILHMKHAKHKNYFEPTLIKVISSGVS